MNNPWRCRSRGIAWHGSWLDSTTTDTATAFGRGNRACNGRAVPSAANHDDLVFAWRGAHPTEPRAGQAVEDDPHVPVST